MYRTRFTSMQSFTSASVLGAVLVSGIAGAAPLDFNVPGDFSTIQEAWNALPSSGNHVINIAPGVYHENLDLSGKAATLLGNASNPTMVVIDGGSGGAAVFIEDSPGFTGPLLKGLTISGGSGFAPPDLFFTYGGGVYIGLHGGAILENCIVRDNAASYGGGLYAAPGTSVQVHETTVTANTAFLGGGMSLGGFSAVATSSFLANEAVVGGHLLLWSAEDSATIIDSEFIDGRASGDAANSAGGAIAILDQQDVSIRSSLFLRNTSENVGGAISCRPFSELDDTECASGGGGCIPVALEISNSTFRECAAQIKGGGIYWLKTGSMDLSELTFEDCTAGVAGGGVSIWEGEHSISSSSFTTCVANAAADPWAAPTGGGLQASYSEVELTDVAFNACSVYRSGSSVWGDGGGAGFIGSTVRIDSSFFDGNFSDGPGGALSVWGSALEVSDSDFSRNTGDAAVWVAIWSSLESNDTSFENCSFGESGFLSSVGDARGAVHVEGLEPLGASARPVLFDQCHFTKNWSALGGGAIRAEAAFVRVLESSFEANDITEGMGSGGAIEMNEGVLRVISSRFEFNETADRGGAINLFDAELFSRDNVYDSNRAASYGGAIECRSGSSMVLTRDSFFGSGDHSDALDGGAIDIDFDAGSVQINESSFGSLAVSGSGGAVMTLGPLTQFDGCWMSGNQATNGGGIHASGVVWLFGSRICGNTPDQVFGAFNDGGGNVIQDNCCRADFNGDGFVDGADLTDLLAEWGTDGSLIAGTDINWDGLVDGGDLNLLLGDWGSCD